MKRLPLIILLLTIFSLPLMAQEAVVPGEASGGGSLQASSAVSDSLASVPDSLSAAPESRLVLLPPDSATAISDSIAAPADSAARPKKKTQAIESDIVYDAKDSIVLIGTHTAILYGEAHVKYQNMDLTANYIRLRLDSSTVYATGTLDSAGALAGTPVFKEGSQTLEAKTMRYNFKTRKGFIYGTVTQQGEGYVTSDKTKKTGEDIYCLQHGKYTTCDRHEHPHFYLALTKAKMKQGKYIVSGPAYMIIEDIPTPLALPFGYFPINRDYSSGIIMPTFGDESSRGFYARNFGYYFAINDYIDLSLYASVYTKGSWALGLTSSYKWRYKFSGSLNINYMRNVYGTPNAPDYNTASDFKILWSHTQDAKMSPNTTFSASVNFSTSSYERNNIDSQYDAALLSQNTKSSTITLTQKFGDSPFSLSVSAYLNQRTSDSTISLSLPELTLSMSKVYPFKRKKRVGSQKWYEKIDLSYKMRLTNRINTKESKFKDMQFLRDWTNGVEHTMPISATFSLFKHMNVTLSMQNTLLWYFRKFNQHWEGDYATGSVVSDTTYGFYNIYTFSGSVTLSTKLYGFYTLKSRKGKQMPVFRHTLTPSVIFSASPDFGTAGWGYLGSYQRPDVNGVMQEVYYKHYNGPYGSSPDRGASGILTFIIKNNLEMKYFSENDTTGKGKKVSIIDNLEISSGYNFIADSLNWSDITMKLRLKFWDKFTANINFAFDPYTYDVNSLGAITRVNVSQVEKNHVLARLRSVSTSFGYTFNNNTFKRKKKTEEAAPQTNQPSDLEQMISDTSPVELMTDRERRQARYEEEDKDYKKFKIPWSLTFNYSIRYEYADFNYDIKEYNRKLTHNLNLSGSISFTDSWNFTFQTSYDITNNKWSYLNCTITKDLHCWQMSASFVPIGSYTSYNFAIGVKSSLLKDLKYEKSSRTGRSINWF